MSTLSRQLAEWCTDFQWRDVPAAVRAQVPLRVLDSVGLIFAGATTEAAAVMLAQARATHATRSTLSTTGSPHSSLIGLADQVPAAMAAMAHGTLAHCRDFDDTFMDSVVHPGSVVIPTALALAEAVNASPEQFGSSIIAGYEVAARVGAVAGRRFHAHHYHATGVVGPLAAAATAARLLGLSGEQLSWAFGLAASMSGGLMAFIADGGWSKWLHAGWAAHGGFIAAELAGRGFRGPEHVLDGGHDLFAALLHGEPIDRSPILADLGRTWRGAEAQFKYYPCAHVIQPYIDALLDIVVTNDLRPVDLASVECAIAPWAAAIVCEPREAKLRFDTELEAIASLPFQLAYAAIERRVDLGALRPSERARNDVHALAERITHRNDASLGHGFDGAIEVQTRDGMRHARKATTAAPDSRKLHAKFSANVGPTLGADRAHQAAERLSATDDWRDAMTIIRSSPTV